MTKIAIERDGDLRCHLLVSEDELPLAFANKDYANPIKVLSIPDRVWAFIKEVMNDQNRRPQR
jgi:predicted methyltransferase